MITNEIILAKSDPEESLMQHTISVISTAKDILDNSSYYNNKILRNDLMLACALHDIGKTALNFQLMLHHMKTNWEQKRHESLSAIIASNIKGIKPEVILAILFHHKNIPDNFGSDDKKAIKKWDLPESLSNRSYSEEYIEEIYSRHNIICDFYSELKERLSEIDINIPEMNYPLNIPDEFALQIDINKNWVIRDNQLNIDASSRQYASLLRGLLISADHMGSAHETVIESVKKINLAFDFKLRDFQDKCSNHKGNLILQAPTGSGKTEACLKWVENNMTGKSKLFYVLPFTASINAMHKRLSKIFHEKEVGILHSSAVHYYYNNMDDDDKLYNQKKATILKRLAKEIYFPVKVCTPHQLLLSALMTSGWETMLCEFKDSCFIFDEIHAYEPKMTGLILGLAKLIKQMGGKIMFVTATMPNFLKTLINKELNINDEIIPDPQIDSDIYKIRHNLKLEAFSIEEKTEEIIELSKSKTILIVTNHVKSSQDIYEKIKKLTDINICLLHGRFNREDRNKKEQELFDNPPKILIATQVVEVSLDINYDCGYFEIAPIDALTQRMGRVNRNGKKNIADITILTQQMSKHNLYNKDITNRTKIELEHNLGPLTEDNLVNMINNVYKDGYTENEMNDFNTTFNLSYFNNFFNEIKFACPNINLNDIFDKTDTIEALPYTETDVYKDKINDGYYLEANALMVNIRRHQERIHYDKILNVFKVNMPYNSEIGLDSRKESLANDNIF